MASAELFLGLSQLVLMSIASQELPVERQTKGMGMCILYGDPHYQTFDGGEFGQMLFRKYDTISTPTGEVGINVLTYSDETPHNANDASVVQYVDVRAVGRMFRMTDTVLTIDGIPQAVPYDKAGVAVIPLEECLRLEIPNVLVVEFYMCGVVLIKVSPSYRSLLNGVCGNFDGNTTNDYDTEVQALPLDDARLLGRTVTTNAWCKEADDYCDRLTDRFVSDTKFGMCFATMKPRLSYFHEACMQDVCAVEGDPSLMKRSMCRILKAVTVLCNQRGYHDISTRGVNDCCKGTDGRAKD